MKRPAQVVVFLALFSQGSVAQGMMPVGGFEVDRTEVTVGAFREFADATGLITAAEQAGGGEVYEAGWVRKPGWTWRAPYGRPAADDEPAVHVTYAEAEAYCLWRGKRLPTDAEWLEAAYTERRSSPPAPFELGRTYPYPTGPAPAGANCLEDCGPTPAIDHSSVLSRGVGHAPAGSTRAGVNGLHEMGANVWEWTDNGLGDLKTTRGGSWWYGARQMHRDHRATKPKDTAAVYIGFRCAR
jgi:sulfatase modifying factor 1